MSKLLSHSNKKEALLPLLPSQDKINALRTRRAVLFEWTAYDYISQKAISSLSPFPGSPLWLSGKHCCESKTCV